MHRCEVPFQIDVMNVGFSTLPTALSSFLVVYLTYVAFELPLNGKRRRTGATVVLFALLVDRVDVLPQVRLLCKGIATHSAFVLTDAFVYNSYVTSQITTTTKLGGTLWTLLLLKYGRYTRLGVFFSGGCVYVCV